MEMLPSVMYVLLPIIGVVIGAILNYWFTKVLEERRHIRNLKTQAYLDSIHHFMNAYFIGEKEETKARLADANERIVIYGSKEVTEALTNIKRVSAKRRGMLGSEFESKFGSEFRRLFTAMVQAMRKDGLPKECVPDEVISLILFGEG